ncbi:MAG TPA: DUF3298/DUF4163 domain-containing protein [Chlorobaculum sp.]|jgi:hypothetical protein|uniref:DUF3298 domain-containing protein n=1 Tax=Chlorobaculum tepidum (strain ATCC 49652 / DSM 12025 / NBRC 103806 / TLS) TaxID=194439 RepID=Q8KDH0_CHLTE|nr:DUF3298 and DUF4163 domain-containing protein [Chlorobaculum tepidum]AAM72313.1 hypothetical protein CT1080 [Chlorobaculum tepidum TLS]HBU22732.1 DUF3298/DUF4163 domain-containing protein [Chlorobaculum sp.]
MKKLFAVFLVFVAMALLPVLASAKSASGPLAFGLYRYEQHSKINAETYWKCDYPVFERSKAGDIINAAILKAVISQAPSPDSKPAAASIEAAASAFIKECDEQMKDAQAHSWAWQSETSGEVLLDRPGMVTVSIFTYAFTGGAHGMSVTQYLIFDTATGRPLGLNDLFKPGFEAMLDKLIERRFRQMRGLSATDPLNGEKGGLFENKITHNENFAVTGSGIRFLYNQYEIAPYAAGQITVDLSFDELKGILKPLPALKPIKP